ncbi:mRNA-degrading endonuclease toxin of MazEF toxin-antitoxin module [Methanocalculus alkaliphilus]|uniref:type II toxin-antitoxin system PemK/MazF family toxin n=1 Tax=Methanocalculus alkaliphilus TaxID=768730 RepID=UPI00209E5A6F|nr:type II toxin-antitoxin system PemK/MazF family toxin [Methanocalculus alkaliphilus]MCP1714835.1 mRNA-degrading endonuclease toxin of MazEF toxin-antitoxin module [Methanocalculus alkaliphilus]
MDADTKREREIMGTYNPRDVVIAPFPFHDGRGNKNRPAVVLSAGDNQLLLVPCTSRPADRIPSIRIDLDDFEEGGLDLFDESYILTTDQTWIPVRKILSKKGRLTNEAFMEVKRIARS